MSATPCRDGQLRHYVLHFACRADIQPAHMPLCQPPERDTRACLSRHASDDAYALCYAIFETLLPSLPYFVDYCYDKRRLPPMLLFSPLTRYFIAAADACRRRYDVMIFAPSRHYSPPLMSPPPRQAIRYERYMATPLPPFLQPSPATPVALLPPRHAVASAFAIHVFAMLLS